MYFDIGVKVGSFKSEMQLRRVNYGLILEMTNISGEDSYFSFRIT